MLSGDKIKTLSSQETEKLWEHLNDFYSRELFDSINNLLNQHQHADATQLKRKIKARSLFATLTDIELPPISDKEEKSISIQALFDDYIEKYISYFLSLKEEVNRKALMNMMNDYLKVILSEISVGLTPADKRGALRNCHKLYGANLLRQIVIINKQTNNQCTFEKVLESIFSFQTDYNTLGLFEIENKKSQKEQAQALIRNYVNQLIMGMKFAEEVVLENWFKNAKQVFGLNDFKAVLSAIKKNDTFPTQLQALEFSNEDMRQKMCIIDIYLHLPDEMSDIAIIRKIVNGINDEIIRLSDPSFKVKPDTTKSMPKEYVPASTPKGSSKNSTSNNARPSQHSGFDDIFHQMNAPLVQMKEYQKEIQLYKNDIIQFNQDSNTNLFYQIANFASFQILDKVLKNTPNAHLIKDQYGNTALHLAALCGHEKAVELLLLYENDFSCNEPNQLGNTPLHCAIISNNEKSVTLIMENGGNINLENVHGYDAFKLAMAVSSKNSQIIELIISSKKFNLNKTY